MSFTKANRIIVAYQNTLAGHGEFGVFMSAFLMTKVFVVRGLFGIMGWHSITRLGRTPYQPLKRESWKRWKVALRYVAYDGELTAGRAEKWCLFNTKL